jgi:hypothetical protein
MRQNGINGPQKSASKHDKTNKPSPPTHRVERTNAFSLSSGPTTHLQTSNRKLKMSNQQLIGEKLKQKQQLLPTTSDQMNKTPSPPPQPTRLPLALDERLPRAKTSDSFFGSVPSSYNRSAPVCGSGTNSSSSAADGGWRAGNTKRNREKWSQRNFSHSNQLALTFSAAAGRLGLLCSRCRRDGRSSGSSSRGLVCKA